MYVIWGHLPWLLHSEFFKEMSAITLFLSSFPTVREVYDFILTFYHFLNILSDGLYVPASASPDSCSWTWLWFADGGALVGAVSVLFLEYKPCLDHVLNWPRIRLLPAVDRSGASESNPSFRYLRCWKMLPKYFFISYKHSTFQGDKPQKKLKSKIYF